MKRLSREERIGAVALALITLIAVGGTVIWRHRSADVTDMPPAITVHTVEDSTVGPGDGDVSSEHKYGHKKHKNKRGKKRNGRTLDSGSRRSAEGTGSRGDAAAMPLYRDFLSDTIPVSGK